MLEQLKYRNHLNEVFEFGKDGIFVNTSDLRDYEWAVQQKGDRISDFTHKVTKKTLPVVIVQPYESWRTLRRNQFYEIVEKDVLAKQPGRIIVGDYYMHCYVTGVRNKKYLTSKQWQEMELTLVTDRPVWIKETRTHFLGKSDGYIDIVGPVIPDMYAAAAASVTINDSEGYLDYPVDFPLDYASGLKQKSLTNNALAASNFEIIIQGDCVDPYVFIAGHLYKVQCTLKEGENLHINALTKEVYVNDGSGQKINVFNCRERSSYIFEKIPVGYSPVTWSGDFSFEVTLYEERSEPKWT